MSQEKTQQREGTFCQAQGRGRRCATGPVSSREIAVGGNVAFSREILPSLLVPTTRHSPQLLARPSGLGLDDTVSFSVDFSTSQGLTSSTWAAERGTEQRLCCWPDIVTFPHLKTNALAANLYSQTLLSKLSPFGFRQAFSKASLQSLYQYPNVQRDQHSKLCDRGPALCQVEVCFFKSIFQNAHANSLFRLFKRPSRMETPWNSLNISKNWISGYVWISKVFLFKQLIRAAQAIQQSQKKRKVNNISPVSAGGGS